MISEADFRSKVRAFIDARCMRRRDMADTPMLDDRDTALRFQRDLFDAGLAGLMVPVEFGGQGLSKRYHEIFNEEAAEYYLPIGLFTITLGMCVPVLLEHGTDDQKSHIVSMLKGDEIWCQMFSEPNAGSDVASLQMRAERDGDEWVLNGQKVWTSSAHYAKFGMCIARTDPSLPKHRGLSMFIVPMDRPGITVRPLIQATGDHGFNEVFCDDVRIPAESLIGAVNDGWRVTLSMLMNERVALGASGNSLVSGRFESLNVAAQASGANRDPNIRQALADIYIREEVLRFTALRVRTAMQAGKAPGPEGSVAKLAGSELVKRAAQTLVAIRGAAATAWLPDDRDAAKAARTFMHAPSFFDRGRHDRDTAKHHRRTCTRSPQGPVTSAKSARGKAAAFESEALMQDSPIKTSSGPVLGTPGDRVVRFLGVPYAQAPTGEGRWRAPVPITPANATSGRDYGCIPWQPTDGPLNGLVPGTYPGTMSEDCLSLNIFTPDTSRARAVMVWIPGGGFQIGTANAAFYDGSSLARRGDVVVVTINYRLGALGWLAIDSDDAAANCGLLDQIEALRWIQKNIAKFGGDPGRVTIFGESAGAGSVLSLLASPHTDGLFHRAIVQSGATELALLRQHAHKVAEVFCEQAGVAAHDVAALRMLPIDTIMAAQTATAAKLAATLGPMAFHPVIDEATMPHSWLSAREAGVNAHVPLLIGTTHDELSLFSHLDPSLKTLDEEGLAARLGESTDVHEVIATYRGVYPDASCGDICSAVSTDKSMWLPALRVAEAHARYQPATYMYRFDWPAADEALGSPHAIDIPFAFDTIGVEGWADFIDGPDRAHLLAKAMQHAWSAFARTGDPTSPNLPTWERFTPDGRATMILGPSPALVHDPRAPIRELWSA